MKKITLAIGLVASLLGNAKAQYYKTTTPIDSGYAQRQLKVEEINFVTSYYNQNGNNSAVTGGIGTEKLIDFANSLELKLTKLDQKNNKHSFIADFNIDYYSSASSDNIDPRSISGASKQDIHIYPSLSWSVKNDKTGITKGLSASFSTEWDYRSYGFTANFAKASKDNNREVSIKASAFLDTWEVILPIELRTGTTTGRGISNTKPRNSYNLALSLSQVINQRLQMMVTVEPSYQEGLLSTPYHRVYFTDQTVTVEKLPGTRLKLPIGIRANYFLGDNAIVKGFYRFYTDDWGMIAHTFNLEVPYKITPFFSVSPYYRFNTQTAVSYFAPYAQHTASEAYYSSDADISGVNTHFVGTGIRVAPPDGVLGIKSWSSFEIRYGHYMRSNGLVANIVTMHLKFK